MPDQYNVRTPLEDQWVDSPAQVQEVIGRYMQTDGAALVRVTVVRLPPCTDGGAGGVLGGALARIGGKATG